jgi:hypothetical protein
LAEHPIASGTLGGFGGFLSKKFRMHDFQLGRRNCQQFLRRYFSIPVSACSHNPVFSHYTSEELERFSFEKDGKKHMPVIPLVGSAEREAYPLVWQTLRLNDQELNELKDRVRARTGILTKKLLKQYIDGWFTRTAARLVLCFKRKSIINSIMDKIEKELREFDLRA